MKSIDFAKAINERKQPNQLQPCYLGRIQTINLIIRKILVLSRKLAVCEINKICFIFILNLRYCQIYAIINYIVANLVKVSDAQAVLTHFLYFNYADLANFIMTIAKLNYYFTNFKLEFLNSVQIVNFLFVNFLHPTIFFIINYFYLISEASSHLLFNIIYAHLSAFLNSPHSNLP